MQVHQKHRWGELSEQVIHAFEERHHLSLPSEYRSFLLKHHGGVPVPNFYWVIPEDWGSGIECLYGFGEEGFFLEEYFAARSQHGVPSDLLPIGDDGCCNLLCIGIEGEHMGAVFYVDCEYGGAEPGKVKKLAESFSAFLEKLTEAPIIERTTRCRRVI